MIYHQSKDTTTIASTCSAHGQCGTNPILINEKFLLAMAAKANFLRYFSDWKASPVYSRVIMSKLDNIFGCSMAVGEGLTLINDKNEESFSEGIHYIEEIIAGSSFRSQGEIDYFKDKDEAIIETLLALLWTYILIPLDRIHDVEDVRNSSFLAIDENSKQYGTACKRF